MFAEIECPICFEMKVGVLCMPCGHAFCRADYELIAHRDGADGFAVHDLSRNETFVEIDEAEAHAMRVETLPMAPPLPLAPPLGGIFGVAPPPPAGPPPGPPTFCGPAFGYGEYSVRWRWQPLFNEYALCHTDGLYTLFHPVSETVPWAPAGYQAVYRRVNNAYNRRWALVAAVWV
jgi:hypothetical protein